jgi:hypothetical protein
LTFQGTHISRPGRLALLLACFALAGLVATAAAGAAGPAPRQKKGVRCSSGYRPAVKAARTDGRARVVRYCKKKATPSGAPGNSSPSVSTPSGPAPTSVTARVDTTAPAPTVPPSTTAPEGTTSPPEGTTPPVEEPTTPPVVETGETEVHAAIGTGFKQNPLVPDEVTWHYSASATRKVTTDGVPGTEPAPLPEGVLAFFVDGRLDCEIDVVGAIAGSACTVDLQALGEHEVEAIYSSKGGALSSTASRTDYLDKYPTQTDLQVSVEPVAPEYLEIGPNAYGFIQYGFEVGRLRINATTEPGGYPTFDCEGQPAGCLEPEIPGLAAHHGSVSVPLYSQNRLNMATGKEEWKVAFHAYNPTAREYGDFWQYPEESVGAQFFHAVSEPEPRLYKSSSVTVPLNLNGGHYPYYHWFRDGELGGSVAAVEGTARKVMDLGTYVKVDGPEEWLKVTGEFHGTPGETEGCVYRLRIDGKDMNEDRDSSTQNWEFLNGWPGFAAGPHTFEMWVERATGAGPGNCASTSGTFEVYEVAH